MLRSALLSVLVLTALGFGTAPGASAHAAPDLHDYTLGQCDGWLSGFECCLYGMGIGFSVDPSGVPPVGPHSNCWQSLDASASAAAAPPVCDTSGSAISCCLYGMGIGFTLDPKSIPPVGPHPDCWMSLDAASAGP